MIKAYAINSKYGDNVRLIELELEEKKSTYKVLKSGIGVYGSFVKKRDIGRFDTNYEQVICFDINSGIEIYKKGIYDILKKEEEIFLKRKDRLLKLLDEGDKNNININSILR